MTNTAQIDWRTMGIYNRPCDNCGVYFQQLWRADGRMPLQTKCDKCEGKEVQHDK